MSIEAALVKPICDAIIAGLKKISGFRVKKNAAIELNNVIRNLLQINPDLSASEAKILAAKAAGVISKELVLAEGMLKNVKTMSGIPGGTATAKAKFAVHKVAAKKPVRKKTKAKVVNTVTRKSPSPTALKRTTFSTVKRAATGFAKRG